MSSSLTKMPYKRFHCRYFDERGRPLDPSCNQGPKSKCLFIHPDDPEWSNPRRTKFSSATRPSRWPSPPDRTSLPRASPLAPQSELYKYCAKDYDREGYDRRRKASFDSKVDRHCSERGRRTTPERERGHNKRTYGEPGPSRITDETRSATKTHMDAPILAAGLGSDSRKSDRFEAKIQEKQKYIPQADNADASNEYDGKELPKYLARLFRSLSRLSNKANQLMDKQLKEEEKMKSYTEISSKISKISTVVATGIIPGLAQVALEYQGSRRHLEETFEAIEATWSKAFDAILTEINHAIDVRLENANSYKQKEPIKASESPSKSLKRGRDEDTRDHRADKSDQRSHKHRRFTECRSTLQSPTKEGKHSLSMERTLREMKSRIDELTRDLEVSRKENNELKRLAA